MLIYANISSPNVIDICNSLDEESVSAISVNISKYKWQKIYMDESFLRLFKSA